MIEDQVAPKRCGHVSSKSMIPFDEAIQLVKAACDDDARAEYERLYGLGSGPLVLARTDMPYRRLLGLPRLYEGGRVGRANAGIL
jgi:2-methylisocitrate lyase-like PEP mutase family enzyme